MLVRRSLAPCSYINDGCDKGSICNVEITNDELPSFLWSDTSYDPDNYDEGLLRGEFTLRVLRHIWTAPSSVRNSLDKGIPVVCNARIHDQYTVTPPMIAYAVVQARSMISSKDWARRDGAFNNEKLFKQVVALFDPADDPWTVETLAWCQRMVFGDAEALPADDSDEPPAPTATDAILAQCAARRAAMNDGVWPH
ncbi:hypothetical protein B0H12DRAFT_285552 [Mycena haematopus]|nr:hypothetical protein B0H12DRAFT_285552 [Mycena haematopus]